MFDNAQPLPTQVIRLGRQIERTGMMFDFLRGVREPGIVKAIKDISAGDEKLCAILMTEFANLQGESFDLSDPGGFARFTVSLVTATGLKEEQVLDLIAVYLRDK